MADDSNQEKNAKNFNKQHGGDAEPRNRGNQRGRKRNNRRRGNKQRGRRYVPNDVTYVCPICGQNVRDVLTAIAFGDEKIPAHFDCIVKKLSGQEELKGKEKIVYLGKGEFGVVRFKGNNGGKFEIIRRIPMEDTRETPITWRKEISKQIKK